MKPITFFLFAVLAIQVVNAQNVGIGTTTPHAKAALDISSTTKGLLIPSMTSVQRTAITSPPNGLMVYDTDVNQVYHHDGSAWRRILNNTYWSQSSTRNWVYNGIDSVGIGTSIPTERLDVNGNIRSRDDVLADGKLVATGIVSGSALQTPGNLTVAGNASIAGHINAFSNLNLNGSIKIADGTQGNGKVLTSDATGNATWKNAAFSNNDRIMLRYNGYGTDSLIAGITTVYDNGGISFSTISKRFTVTKAGLYHFEGAMTSEASYDSNNPPVFTILRPKVFMSIGDNLPIKIAGELKEFRPMELVGLGDFNLTFTLSFNIDIYLSAGERLTFRLQDRAGTPDLRLSSRPGFISAYLISE